MLDYIKSGTVYTMGRSGAMEPVKVEGFEIGQAVWYEGWSGSLAWVVGSDMFGYTIITEDLSKHNGMTGSSLSPYTRIKPATGHEAINAEQIAELEAKVIEKRAQDKIEQETAAKLHAEEVAKIAAELRAKYPNANSRYPGKTLKAELTKAFPGVKFSVTSDYNSINIGWTDGPTVKQVEGFSSKYQHGNFDGMTDSYDYDHSAHSDAVSSVLGSVGYVFENRKLSPELMEAVKRDLIEKGEEPKDDYNRNTVYMMLEKAEIYGEYQGLELIDNQGWVPQFSKKAEQPRPEATKEAISVQPVAGVTVRENTEKQGIEIIFDSKPSAATLTSLKANGFRWSKFQSLWYTRATDEAREFASKLEAK